MINKFGFYKQAGINSPEHTAQPIKQQQHPGLQPIRPAFAKKRTYLNVGDYHPYQVPPNMALAELHRLATQFGMINLSKVLDAQTESLICNCCGQEEKQLMPINCPINKIIQVNEAQGFYFIFIKLIIASIFVLFVISGIYTLVKTIDYCSHHSDCAFVYKMPIPPLELYQGSTNIILNVVSAFTIYPFIGYLFYKNALIHQRIKSKINRLSDYSLLMTGLDFEKIADKDLVQVLGGYDVESILFTHKIGQYLPLMEQKYIYEAKKNLFFKRGMQKKLKQIERLIHQIDNKVLPFKNTLNLGKQREMRTDKIIVKFNNLKSKQQFLNTYHLNFYDRTLGIFLNRSQFKIKEVPLFVQNLGEPQQIIWQNIEVSSKYKFVMVIINTIANIIILFGSLMIVLKLTHEENKQEESQEVLMSFVLAFLIEIINALLYLAIYQLTQMEKRITLTGKMIARIIRNVCVFFFNTTLIPFSLFLLGWFNAQRRIILEYIISLFVVNNLISPLSPIFNPFTLYKFYCQYKIDKQGKDCLFTQSQTNQIYEKINFQLELRYELLTQRIMNCCFYASVFPQVIILTIIGLVIDYWVEKWWLLSYCCIPKYSFRLGKIINRISLFFPCIYLFGYFANLLMMKDQKQLKVNTSPMTVLYLFIISVALSILLIVFIEELVAKYILAHESLIQNEQSILVKQLDYCDLNPTSFLHLDIKNTVTVGSKPVSDTFGTLQEFLIKGKRQKLIRKTQMEQRRNTELIERKYI